MGITGHTLHTVYNFEQKSWTSCFSWTLHIVFYSFSLQVDLLRTFVRKALLNVRMDDASACSIPTGASAILVTDSENREQFACVSHAHLPFTFYCCRVCEEKHYFWFVSCRASDAFASIHCIAEVLKSLNPVAVSRIPQIGQNTELQESCQQLAIVAFLCSPALPL